MITIDWTLEIMMGLAFFIISGFYYGVRSVDVKGVQTLFLALGSALMAFMVFGSVLTLVWLVMMPFGIHVGIPNFPKALLLMTTMTVMSFYVSYAAGLIKLSFRSKVKA